MSGSLNGTKEIKDYDSNCIFTVKKDSLPEDIYIPNKADVDRESLHRLPKRKQSIKNENFK